MKKIAFRRRPAADFILLVLIALMPAGAVAQRREARRDAPLSPPASALSISYELGMTHPVTHLFEATMLVENIKQPAIEVQFPVWTPGAYRVIDAARNVQEFRATTTSGQPLSATKTQTNTWRVETRGNSAVKASYKVYANQLSVSGIDLDDTHAYFNGALLFPYVVGAKERPVTLTINKPARWDKISTGLDQLTGRPNVFTAPDYDTFIDAPTEIGTHRVLRFTYENVPCEIAIYGNHNYDLQRFQSEIEGMVRSQVEMFGRAPFERYVFIYHMTPTGGGGLEHLNSTVIGLRKYGAINEEGWDRFRGVTSHEFFHLWNVKRIRPDVLGPFNYAAQVPTRYLYISEGMTSYYGDLHIRRSGLWTPERYLKRQAEVIETLQRLPGRRILTVEESSINTWLAPDNALNNSFSYYTKGDLIGMLLDLEIRHRTNNARSLDDVFRYLYDNYALPKPGFPLGGFEGAVETVAGSDFDEFFAKYVSGTKELPYDQVLGYVGLRLERRESEKPDFGLLFTDAPRGTIGLTVRGVSSESPAYNVLAPGDVLLAVDGERVTEQTLPIILARFGDKQIVPLTIFRGDRLLQVSLTKVNRNVINYAIVEVPSATAAQKALREAWLTGKRS